MTKKKTTLAQMMEEAKSEIERISAEDAIAQHASGDAIFVDIRDVRELWREGTIPDSMHAPRGMLEWWADAESPYHKEAFSEDKTFVLF